MSALDPRLGFVETIWQIKRERAVARAEADDALLDKAAEIEVRREREGAGRLREHFGPFTTIKRNAPLTREYGEVQ